MKTNILPLAGAACAAALLLGGCANTMNTLEPAGTVAQRQMLSDKRLITDTTLHNRVQPVGINTATGPGGFLKIQVELMNTTGRAHRFTYRIEWFDEAGMIINSPIAVSTPRTIEGGETIAITAMAPTDRAKDFRIKFMESP
ncbi:MAG: YcfL family protein [bacterium]